jgi:hypothetical protein
VALPVEVPKHIRLVTVVVTDKFDLDVGIVTAAVLVQPAESVTVMVYVPALKFLAVSPVCVPGDHLYVYGFTPPLT